MNENNMHLDYEEGYNKGYDEGFDKGYDTGYEEAEEQYKPSPFRPHPEYDRGYKEGVETGRQWAESLIISRGRIKEIVRTVNGAEAEKNRTCLDRDYGCPWCYKELEIEYCQKQHYIVRCPCRATIIQATSPLEAARKCAFYLRPISEYHEDDGPVLGYPDPQIEDARLTCDWPQADNVDPDDFKYWTPIPHIAHMPEKHTGTLTASETPHSEGEGNE